MYSKTNCSDNIATNVNAVVCKIYTHIKRAFIYARGSLSRLSLNLLALSPPGRITILLAFTFLIANNALADYTINAGDTTDPFTTPALINATGTISIYGTMILNSDVTFTSANPLAILIYGAAGTIEWTINCTLAFPAGTTITYVNNPVGLLGSPASASKILQIGEIKYASANDNSNNVVYSFDQINSIGGTPRIAPSTTTPAVCFGAPVNLSANQVVPSGDIIKINWLVSPVSGTFGTNNNSATATNITLSGLAVNTYTVTCELYSDAGSGNYFLVTSKSITVVVNAVPSATISYAGSPFCNNAGNVDVTFSGTVGGTYSSSPSGAVINSTSGSVNLASSFPGTYTITYTIAPSGGCAVYTTNKVIVINPNAWIGKSSSDWNTAGNWAGTYTMGCPDVTILGGVPYQPVLNSGTTAIKNLVIDAGANLTLTNAKLQISGTITNYGIFAASAGTVEMNGSSAQTIAGSLFANKVIKNLIVSNTGAGLSVSSAANDTLKITGALTFGNSNSKLNTGDNIDLVSDINATASVGIVNPGNIITGKVIAERYIPTGIAHGKGWQFLAAPTNSQTIRESWMEGGMNTTIPNRYGAWITGTTGTAGGFDASSATPAMKTYSPATDTWITVGNPTTTPLHNDNGYMIFVRGDRSVVNAFGANSTAIPTNLRSKGTLLTGTLPAINVPAGKYQSIGNPYASRIEFSKLSKTNIDNVFYVWDPLLYGAYGYGGYQTLSATNNFQPTAPNNTATAHYQMGVSYPYIESGQAFFVHNSTSANGSVIFAESSKAGNSRLVTRMAKTVTERQFLRSYLFADSTIVDGNAVAFDNDFVNTVDADDAFKIMNSGENFGLKRSGKILAVEARMPIENTDTIFYNLNNLARKTYRILFEPQNMQGSGLSAYLIDKYLKTTTPVSLDQNTSADITINADPVSSVADRLLVVFKLMAPLPVTFTSVKAVQKNINIEVDWKVENENNMLQYEVQRSLNGNQFVKMGMVKAINGAANDYTWLDVDPAPGYNYYRIHSIDLNGQSKYSNIVKVFVGKVVPAITVQSNPILNSTIKIQFTNQAEGPYKVSLLNPLGQVMVSKMILLENGTSLEKIKLNNQSVKGIYLLEIIKPDGKQEVIQLLN